MAGRLVVLDRAGRAKSKSFALGSGMCTLGRSAACDIRVLLPDVSPHHATVSVHASQTVVRNVGSGITLVNGAPISVHALQHGDEMALGGRLLRWEYDAPQMSRRGKAQPVLALPPVPAPARAARRGTLAAAPRAPDRELQLALELRHRASMPASAGTGGKQVAIVQPQRRNTDNQNEASRPAPAPRKASTSARLHTPTKATLWIESRRGRARASSLRTATPLRLAVLRKALTPAKLQVTKIQAPLHIDHTKRAAIMLMTGHTPKSKLASPAGRGPGRAARGRGAGPAAAAERGPGGRGAGPAAAAGRGAAPGAGARGRAAARPVAADAPDKSARTNNTRNSGKRSVSVLEITDSESSRRSPGPANPRKSALKSSGRRSRKTESIKFDLSNLENHSRDDSDILMVSSTNGDATEDGTLRYSTSSPSPSPRRSIHSRSGRMLASSGSPMRSPASIGTVESPASPRSLKSARGSIIVQKALESSDTFVTESHHSRLTGSPRRRELEAYSVVDLVSLESDTSRSVYGSAGSPPRSAALGTSTPLPGRAWPTPTPTTTTMTTPENVPRVTPRSSRVSRGGRSRSRLDDSTRTIDSIEDDSPKSSRKLKSATKRSLDDGFPESPRTYISLDSSRKSLGTISPAMRGSRGRLGDSPLESPEDVSIVSTKRSLGRKLSDSKRGSRSLNVSTPPSSTDVSLVSMNKSSGTKFSTSISGSRFEDGPHLESPKDEASPNAPRNSRRTLSITIRGSSNLNDSHSSRDVDSPKPSRKSSTKRASRSQLDNSVSLESHKNKLAYSSRSSLGNTLSATKRGSRGQVDDSITSPNTSRHSAGKTSSKRGFSVVESPKTVSDISSRKSVQKSISKRGSRSKLSIVFSPKPVASESPEENILANSTRNCLGKPASTSKRASRSKLIDSVLSSPVANALSNSTRTSAIKTLSTSKRDSRRQLVDSLFSSPKDALANSTRKSVRKTPSTSNRGSHSKLIDKVRSSSPIADTFSNSTRKSVGKTPSTSKHGRSQLVDSVLSSPSLSKTDASSNSTRKSVGKAPASKRGSRSKLIDSVLSSSLIANALANSTRKSASRALSTSGRGRSQLIDSVLSSPNLSSTDALVDSTRESVSTLERSRSQLDESVLTESPKDLYTSRKSRTTTPSTSSRRTRSLPLESPQASRDSSRKSRISAISTSKRSTRGPNTSLPESPLKASPAKSLKSPTRSPKSPSVLSKTKNSRKTLTLSIIKIDNNVSTGGEVTPEERGSPENACTPVLSIRSLLDASVPDSPSEPPRKRGRLSDKRKTFANARDAGKNHGALRSKSLILTRDTGDVTPTGVAEPTPEAVKSKHSSAKKSRSRRSIIDTLDDSGLVKHLFNSPVKRKLSQSMSEFSRRLEEPETSPNVSGVKRLLTKKSAKNELTDSHGGRHLLRTPRARRSIKNDLSDVRGVKVMFAAAPRDSLGDVRGVKRTFQASPNDDLRRVSGVKDLFQGRKPRDDLSDVRGVRELFKRGQKDELNATGVKEGLQVRSPRNDLRDVRGVRKLFQQSKAPTSPNVSGVARLLDAEAQFDRLAGRPPLRATYSRTFVARSANKPAGRRRTRSLSVPVDVLVNNVEGWLKEELQKRLSGRTARALQKLATDTVAGGTPIIASRSRPSAAPGRSAAESYAEHTLPLKKRSLEKAPEPRSAKKRNLPLKKRALIHSTPVKGRESRAADATLARMSPIAREAPVQGSPFSPRNSLTKSKQTKASEAEKVVEKNESIKPSPKKTRARRTEEVANSQRATRARGGKKATSPKKATPKKAPAAKKAPVTKASTPNKSLTPIKTSNAKVPTPTEVAHKEPTPKASRSKKVTAPTKVATPKSTAPKKATRSKKIPTPKKSPPPKKATRAKLRDKVSTPKPTRTKKVLTPTKVTPKKSPALQKATRGKKILTPVKAATPKKPTVVVKKPRAVVATASPRATRAKKTLKSPVNSPRTKQSRTKKAHSPGTVPVEKRSRRRASPKAVSPKKRGRADSPLKRAVPVSFVLPKLSPILKPQPAARPKRSKNEPAKESQKKYPVRGKNAAAGDAPAAEPTRGRKGAPARRARAAPAGEAAPPVQNKGRAAPEPRRARRAPPTPEQKSPAPTRKKAEARLAPESKRKKAEVPEPKRSRKAAATSEAKKKGAEAVPTPASKKTGSKVVPEPKGRGRKAASEGPEEPASKRGRKAAPAPREQSRSAAASRGQTASRGRGQTASRDRGQTASRGRGQTAGRPARAPTEAARPKGTKAPAAVPVAEESAPRGRKRKNDTTSLDEQKAPAPKKARAGRAAAAPSAAASSRGRRR